MGFSWMTKKDLIGLDIGSGAIKLVQIKKAGRGYRLVKFGVKTLDPELIVDGTVVDASRVVSAIKTLLEEQGVKEKNVALSVSGHAVIVKKVGMPVMTEEALEESIKWEAEQYIPFDINDVNLDFHILDRAPAQTGDQGQMDVLLVAVKKDKLAEYTQLATEAGLVPVVVDVDAFSLENMYTANYEVKNGEVVALLNIGANVLNINILKNGAFAFTRDISIGGNKYTEAIQRDFHIDYAQAEKAKQLEAVEGVEEKAILGIIDGLNAEIATEVSRSFDYYKTTSNNEQIHRILLSGGTSKMPQIRARMEEKTGVPTEALNPFNKIQIPQKSFDLDYIRDMAPLAAVGVGLAMRRVGDR